MNYVLFSDQGSVIFLHSEAGITHAPAKFLDKKSYGISSPLRILGDMVQNLSYLFFPSPDGQQYH